MNIDKINWNFTAPKTYIGFKMANYSKCANDKD